MDAFPQCVNFFLLTSLLQYNAQTVRDTYFCCKKYCCTGLGHFKFRGHQNRITGYKIYGNFEERVDFAYWWSFIGKGLCLQPAQEGYFILPPDVREPPGPVRADILLCRGNPGQTGDRGQVTADS